MSAVLPIWIDAPQRPVHAQLARAALLEAAAALGRAVTLDARAATRFALLVSDDASASAPWGAGVQTQRVGVQAALANPRGVLEAALVQLDAAAPAPAAAAQVVETAAPAPSAALRIVAITSCPTGIAHTFMAEEGLKVAAAALGHAIRVETQGSVGAQNALTAEEIAAADVVIIAADTQVALERFVGKRLFRSGTKAAIKDGKALIAQAQAEAVVHTSSHDHADAAQPSSKVPNDPSGVSGNAAPAKSKGVGAYKHLMTGVSFMLPFVVTGGLLIALGFALGGIYVYEDQFKGTLGWTLFTVGKQAFALMVPVLAGYIAYSIADRPGITPGMAGGMVASAIGAGFLGGLLAGFIAGYTVKFLNQHIQLGRNLDGLKPVLILPLLGTMVVGLLMYYVIGQPVAQALAALAAWLKGMQTGSAVALGLILGAMMAADMGGPINKAAYTFGTGLIASEVYAPMAAVMAAGMTPPLAIALAAWLFRNRFSEEERNGARAAGVMGLAFITEGAIPFAARDPLRVIPALVAGSALAGAISMAAGAQLRVPHGGAFVLPIPNAVDNLGMYLVAIAAGTLLSAVLLGTLKKPVAAQA